MENNSKLAGNYSINIEKFNDDCRTFIDYVKQLIEKGDSHSICLSRMHNIIKYYGKEKNNTIEMVSTNDLRNLYEMLKNEFSSNFEEYFVHDIMGKCSVFILINNKISVEITSSDFDDKQWLYPVNNVPEKTYTKKI